MRLIAPFTFIAFFLSGISALVYELTWTRLLKHVFGSDSLALSTMLTVFIGGIAVGTFIAGKLIEHYFRFDHDLDERSQNALNLGQAYSLMFGYCCVELVLGLYAFIVPILLGPNVLGRIWSVFAAYSLEHAFSGSLLKFIISALLLIIPTILMGISFPLLTELLAIHNGKNFTTNHTDQLAASNLYATNTFGAILGACIGGFFLLPNLGLNTSIYIGALINIFIAIFSSTWFFFNKDQFSGADPKGVFKFINEAAEKLHSAVVKTKLAHVKLSDNERRYQRIVFILLSISFILGFINLSLEVIWTKILTLVIGSSTYSLTIILIAVLSGISLGAYLLNWTIKLADLLKLNPISFLKSALLSFAVLIFISSSLFNKLPWIFLKLSQALESGLDTWLTSNVLKFCVVAIIALPVTLIEGLIFAFILYLISSDTNLIDQKLQEPVGTRVARASYINTTGAIIGSFITGFIFIPLFSQFGSGLYFSLEILIAIAFVLAIAPYFIPEIPVAEEAVKTSKLYGSKQEEVIDNGLKAWFKPKVEQEMHFSWNMLPILILMCAAMILLPQLNSQEIASGVSVYSGLKYKALSKKEYQNAISETILFHREGLNSIVTVVENQAANAIFLKTNGKIEAGKPIRAEDPSKADMLTQILLGQLPILIKPESKTALLIGMGSGISLKSLVKLGSQASLNKVDICEIEEQVYRAAEKFFNAPSGLNYKGVELHRHVADARNYLQALNSSRESIANYDLIISQPSDPWISSNLFTEEFWKLAANNLSNEGVFVQWLQLYSIDPEFIKITLSTFQSIFPEVMVFRPGNAAELIIVGSKSKIDLDSQRIKTLINSKEAKKELASIGINDEGELFTNLLLVPESVRDLIRTQGLSSKRNSAKEIKVLKYISKIDKDSNEYQPKLTELTSSTELTKHEVSEPINHQLLTINTDDNMLLEFHTSQKINEFYESIKANEDFLISQINASSIIKFLAEDQDPNLLIKIANAHSKINTKLNQKLALALAQELFAISPSPAAYLTLYEIHRNKLENEEADSILYQAQSLFSDVVSVDRRSNVTIFEGLIEGTHLNAFQLASLALIYGYSEKWTQAEALINKAIELDLQNSNFYVYKADIEFKELKAQSGENLSKKAQVKFLDQLETIEYDYNLALEKDALNPHAHQRLAEFNLFKKELEPESSKQFTSQAVNHLNTALKINPRAWQIQLALAEIYLAELPNSQIEFMKAPESTINHAIKYLSNALLLNPYSLEANYQMAELQYKLGSMDLAYKHSNRLNQACAHGTVCVDQLGLEKVEEANKLHTKLTRLVKGQKQIVKK